jgi:hypothetical protein
MAARVHTSLKVIVCNANGIWKQCYELSKQLQDLRIDVALLSETHLKPKESILFPIITFIRLIASQEKKAFPTTM